MEKKTLADIFVDGAKKGWTIGVGSILPNVLMAFALIQVLRITGLLTIMNKVFGPVMGVFGLPGEAITVLMAAWLSMGGAGGVAATLFASKILSGTQVTILVPAIFLMGAQVQYMGRLLGTAGVQTRFYPMLFGISIMNALLAMLVMRFIFV